MEVGEGVVWVDSDGFLEVLDGKLVIAHILVHKTSLNVNGLISWQERLDL